MSAVPGDLVHCQEGTVGDMRVEGNGVRNLAEGFDIDQPFGSF